MLDNLKRQRIFFSDGSSVAKGLALLEWDGELAFLEGVFSDSNGKYYIQYEGSRALVPMPWGKKELTDEMLKGHREFLKRHAGIRILSVDYSVDLEGGDNDEYW